jgi:hypothetical protein
VQVRQKEKGPEGKKRREERKREIDSSIQSRKIQSVS